ncbi:MAG: T9SS type A sorting domain-containing protein [Bacteroidota bacterium]
MKTTLLLTFILCTHLLSAQWTRITNSPSIANTIYFFNAQTGYALKQDTIFKTTDGGANWSDIHAGFPSYTSLKKIRFVSPDTGFVYGMDATSFAYPVSIYMTINGGANWNRILGPYDGTDLDFYLAGQNDWYFHSTSQWLAPVADTIFHTTNGGFGFSKTGNTTLPLYNQQINNLVLYSYSVTAGPAQHDQFNKSTDGGATWNVLLEDSSVSAGIVSHQFVNSSDGYVLVYQYVANDNIESRIYKTSNGGSVWSYYDLPAAVKGPQYMHFTDVNTGYIISYASPGFEIYKTTNGGQTWTLDFTPNFNEYFSGDEGFFNYFGKLYVLANNVITLQIATGTKELAKDELNFSLYPNPVSGSLTMHTQALQKHTDFVILDMTGKEVHAFSVGEGASQTIDISFLSSGLYLVKLTGSNQSVLLVKE